MPTPEMVASSNLGKDPIERLHESAQKGDGDATEADAIAVIAEKDTDVEVVQLEEPPQNLHFPWS